MTQALPTEIAQACALTPCCVLLFYYLTEMQASCQSCLSSPNYVSIVIPNQ